MHRSAIGAISIDLPESDVGAASDFWAEALAADRRPGTQHPEFTVLSTRVGHAAVLLQRVGDPAPRVHLDLHTDDLEAEVARLGALGATELARHGGWVVMRDPAGTVFCVVPVDADDPLLEGAPTHGR